MSDIASPAPSTGAAPATSPNTSTQAPTSSSGIPNNSNSEKPNNVPRETSTGNKTLPVGDKAPPAQQQPGETKSEWQKRVFKLKVDDQEIEREYETEADLIRDLQKGIGSEKRFQEVAKKEATIKSVAKMILEDPKKFLMDPRSGISKDVVLKMAEDIVYEKLQQDLMDPKDRKIKELESEREQRLAKEKEQEEEAKAKDLEVRQSNYVKTISDSIVGALSAPEAGLPNTPETVKRIAMKLKACVSNKIRPEMNRIIEEVRNDYVKEHTSVLGKMSGEQIFKVMGEEFFKKVRDYDLSRLKTNPPPAHIPGREKRPETGGTGAINSWSEWQKNRRK